MNDRNDRDRDRQSLRDLAKLSQQTGPLSSSAPGSVRVMPPPPSGVADNSGLIDLERLSEAIRGNEAESSRAAALNAGSAPTAPVSSSDGPPVSGVLDRTPLSPSAEELENAAVDASARPETRPSAGDAATPESKPKTAVSGGAAVAAIVAIGAGAFFFAGRGGAPSARDLPPASGAAESARIEPPPVAQPVPIAAQPAAAVASAPSAPAAAVEARPVVAAKVTDPPKPEAAAQGPSAPAKATSSPVKSASAAKTTDKSFADEMAAAVTGKLQTNQATEAAPAAGPTGPAAGIAKPGTGQVTAAFTKVKGAAHNCLGGQDVEVKTTVTFASDGKVTKVSVSNAPDGAIAACIEGAVSKAAVPPFTDSTFSAPLTVR